ncbi:MAG: imidazole glycerol phosphate synthase subunit HisH [Flavobacteriales bacterium]|nr:imidazole glycerol phosphate synthase subunit HisH [Flavobacteriales bacterium]|tara:strand:- start:3254 stop:3868 length:615 start_codon:yes stop_codon:yes gene_type:complete
MVVGVVNYGMGNIHSVLRKLKLVGANYKLIESPDHFENVDKIILPGVGHFGQAMENLKRKEFIDPLHKSVIIDKKPILGICLGMQLMTSYSEEGNSKGLGWIEGEVKHFNVSDGLRYKVPHMGWNKVKISKSSKLFENIKMGSEFYFVHSYYFKSDHFANNLNITNYESDFVSAFEKENIYGVQYHPEKSFEAGTQLFKNFIAL